MTDDPRDQMIRNQAQLIASMRSALIKIACYDDLLANARLNASGSYALFDEPSSVQIAREVLSHGQ